MTLVHDYPYFCTRCNRQHVRGAIYTQHQEYNLDAENQRKIDGREDNIARNIGDDSPTCTTTFGLCPTFQSECGKHNSTTCPPIMEVETPTHEEILASIDKACAEAAIPESCIPTIVSGANGGTVEKWEPHMDFQKYSEFPDRAIEAVQHEAMPAMKHGEPIKKRRWWRR